VAGVGEEGLSEGRWGSEDRRWRWCGVGRGRGAESGASGARRAAKAAGGVPVRAAAVRGGDAALHGLHLARQRAPRHLAPGARVDVPQPAALRPPARRHGRRQRDGRGELILPPTVGRLYCEFMSAMEVFARFR
jgi:hypothetical protein